MQTVCDAPLGGCGGVFDAPGLLDATKTGAFCPSHPMHSHLARDWDRDPDQHVVETLLAVVKPDFKPKTWEAFQRFGVDGVPAERVARELGLSENAVILAKSRVLKRLRQEAGDLLG
jgi:hypothetical protein